jgi:hypothetical protein
MKMGRTAADRSQAKPKGTRERAGLKRRMSELEIRLRKWGRVFGPPPPAEWDEEKSGTRGAKLPILLGGARLGMMTLTDEPLIHGKWLKGPFGDKEFVPTRWTAKGKQSDSGRGVWHPDPDADGVEQVMLELYRIHPVRACALRAHYCLRLSRVWGTWQVCKWLDIRLTRANYRREFEFGRVWIGGRLRLDDGQTAEAAESAA